MYYQRRSRRDGSGDRRQDGNGRRQNNGLRYPFIWFFNISTFTSGILIGLGRLYYLGFRGDDFWATARISSALTLGGLFGMLALMQRIHDQRQEELQAERLLGLEPVEGRAEYEIPPAPTEPEPAQRGTPNRSNRRNRRRKSKGRR